MGEMKEKKIGDVMLEVKDLVTSFRIGDEYHAAVDHLSLEVRENEVFALVGESGCGKSATALSIMRLHNEHFTNIEGEIFYRGVDLLSLSQAELNEYRGKELAMIFQDPLSALNPLMTVGEQIEESLYYHTDLNEDQRAERAVELLDDVGILNPELTYNQYPHELSGGMRQRAMIAIALSCKPSLVIADEPTTALDVTIQAQILGLLVELQEEMGSGVIMITHDLGVVAEIADRVAVMYAGQIVEVAPVNELFKNPTHPYTRLLLASTPDADMDSDESLRVIRGMVPSLVNLPRTGCRFAERIPWVPDDAHEKDPQLHKVGEDHYVRCTCYKDFRFEEEGDF